jgi:hypothetical protein
MDISDEVSPGAALFGVGPFGAGRLLNPTEAAEFEKLRRKTQHLRDGVGTLCGRDQPGDQVTARPSEVNCVPCRRALGRPVNQLRNRDTADAILIDTARVQRATFVTNETIGTAALRGPAAYNVPLLSVPDFFARVLAAARP